MSKRQLEEDDIYGGQEPIINLIYQGKVLLNDVTIDDVGVRDGDTLVAVMEPRVSARTKTGEESNTHPAPVEGAAVMGNREMMEFLTKQHEITAAEMRWVGWDALLHRQRVSVDYREDM